MDAKIGSNLSEVFSNVTTQTPVKCPVCDKHVRLIAVNILANGIQTSWQCLQHGIMDLTVTTGQMAISGKLAEDNAKVIQNKMNSQIGKQIR